MKETKARKQITFENTGQPFDPEGGGGGGAGKFGQDRLFISIICSAGKMGGEGVVEGT